METIVEKYKTWLIANSKSNNTVFFYVANVSLFFKTNNITEATQITEDMINSYFAKMKETNSQATINQHISSLKSFFDFTSIMIRLPKTKCPMRKVVEVVTEEDYLQQIEYVVDYEFMNPLKIKAVLAFLYYCGLRVADVPKVRRSQFDFNNNIVTVKIYKQNLEKKIILPEVLKPILIKYFASESEDINAFNMTVHMIKNAFRKLKEQLPELKLHPHKFRKSYATNAHKLGMAIDEIQEMMGHKNIATTQIYVKVDEDRIREKYLRLEADKMKKLRKRGKHGQNN